MLLVLGFPQPLLPTRNYHHPPTLPTQSLQPMNSLSIGPRTSPPLTSLMLSRQTFRLKIITFPAESCGYELIISSENNANPDGRVGARTTDSGGEAAVQWEDKKETTYHRPGRTAESLNHVGRLRTQGAKSLTNSWAVSGANSRLLSFFVLRRVPISICAKYQFHSQLTELALT